MTITKLINDFSHFHSFRSLYWKDTYKNGVQEIQRALDATYDKSVPLHAAALRWLAHHSKLADDDGIIIGVSKMEHLEANIDALNGDPLHEDVVKAFDKAWDGIKSDCPLYHH